MTPQPDPRNVIVNYIPDSVTEHELRDMFSNFGPVKRCCIIKDEDGNSKGYGFVYFEDAEAAKRAVAEMTGHRVGSKRLRVDHALGRGNARLRVTQGRRATQFGEVPAAAIRVDHCAPLACVYGVPPGPLAVSSPTVQYYMQPALAGPSAAPTCLDLQSPFVSSSVLTAASTPQLSSTVPSDATDGDNWMHGGTDACLASNILLDFLMPNLLLK